MNRKKMLWGLIVCLLAFVMFNVEVFAVTIPSLRVTSVKYNVGDKTSDFENNRVKVGETFQLYGIMVYGNDMGENLGWFVDETTVLNPVWSSSNEDVATVSSDGLVTAIKDGKVTITLSAESCDEEVSCINYYEVVVFTDDGLDGESDPSSEKTPLEIPKFKLTTGDGNIKVTITNYEKDVTYYVYRSTSSKSGFKKIGVTDTFEYVDSAVSVNTKYYYRVVGVREDEKTSFYTANKTNTLNAPSISVSVIDKTTVNINYDKLYGATGYQIYRATSKNGKYTLVKDTKGLTFNNTKLTTNKAYYYKVRAYKTINGKKQYSKYSSILSATPMVAKPRYTVLSAGYDKVKINITKVAGASGYQIYRATSKNGKYTLVKDVTTLSYTNSGLTTNKTYYYKVRAYAKVGGVKKYGAFNKVLEVVPVLETPSFKVEAEGIDSIKLTINKVNNASGYVIYRKNENGWVNLGTTSYLTYLDKGLESDTEYTYTVRAVKVINKKKVYSDFIREGVSGMTDKLSVVKTFTITFDSDGGTAIDSQVVNEDDKVSVPFVPSKRGAVFLGWFLNDTEYDFTRPVISDLSLKAKWKLIGDVNEDGVINDGDLGTLFGYLVGEVPSVPLIYSDVDADDKITLCDYYILKSYIYDKNIEALPHVGLIKPEISIHHVDWPLSGPTVYGLSFEAVSGTYVEYYSSTDGVNYELIEEKTVEEALKDGEYLVFEVYNPSVTTETSYKVRTYRLLSGVKVYSEYSNVVTRNDVDDSYLDI